MYFITAFEDIDDDWGTKGSSRCFGYYKSREKADNAVYHNVCDINETIYDYVVIEYIGEGIHAISEQRWFYKFNYNTRQYYPILEPEGFKNICNIAIG